MRNLTAGAEGRWGAAVAAALTVTLWAHPGPALAATTFTVTGTGDAPGATCVGTVCDSLRAAVTAAAASPGSTVQLGATIYTLSQSALVIAGPVTIAGAGDGTGGTAIEQTHAGDRVIRVTATGQVTISGVQITGGELTGANGGLGSGGGDARGGGIFNASAQLTLDHVAVTNNTATGGDGGTGNATVPFGGVGGEAAGGIFSSGQLTLIDSAVTLNVAKAGDAGDGAAGNANGDGGFGGDAVGGILEQGATGPTLIQGSTITGNKATGGVAGHKGGGPSDGGGGSATGAVSLDAQALTLTGTTVSSNTATGGAGTNAVAPASSGGNARGGLFTLTSPAAALAVSDSTFSANTARGGNGGAGGFALGGALTVGGMTGTVSNSTITGNHVTAGNTNGGAPPSIGGGGVFVESGSTVTLTDTTIAQNALTGSSNSSGEGGASCGAGLLSQGFTTLIRDTIAANTASGGPGSAAGHGGSGDGAGLCLFVFGTTVVLNSTITGNLAAGGSGGAGGGTAAGGGVELQFGGAELANDTVASNGASAGSGGTATGGNVLVATGSMITLTLADTIIAGGTLVGGSAKSNCSMPAAQVVDQGHNLESTTPSQCRLGAGDVIGADPMLGALAANGGPTQTIALSPGSPAIGAGGACVDATAAGSPPLLTDQRGLPRTAPCDVGAFQVQKPANTVAPAITGTAAVGQALACSQGSWSGDGTLTFAYQWQRDGVSIPGATDGSHTVTSDDAGHALSCAVTATSPYASATADSAAVSIPPPSLPNSSPPSPSVSRPPKPSITHVSESHKRWRRSSKTAKIARAKKVKRSPVATTFKFTLNTAATVTLKFTHKVEGRRSAGKCVTPSRRNRHKPKCHHTVTAGTLTFAKTAAGAHRITFAGRLSKHKTLGLGSYSVTIAVANSSGHASAKALRFTIVKR